MHTVGDVTQHAGLREALLENAHRENAPCSRLSERTGLASRDEMPASANAASRAPKLCPIRCTRTSP